MLTIPMAFVLVAASCSGGNGSRSSAGVAGDSSRACSTQPQQGTPFESGPSAEARLLSTGGDGMPRVDAVVYPHPDYDAKLWSQWGQGVVLPDGRYYSALGDEEGRDGNAFFYEYEPESGTLTQIANVQKVVGHRRGAWGYGKVHGQLVPACGKIFAVTYWGSNKGIEYGAGYEGDRLLLLDPAARKVASLGVPVPRNGVPSLAGGGDHLLFGESVDPTVQGKEETQSGEGKGAGKAGSFFVYDVERGGVTFTAKDVPHAGYRNVLVDKEGNAYFAAGDARLWMWRRSAAKLEMLDARLPGATLRASTRPGPDGTIYGVTMDPDVIFALRPSGQLDTLTEARGYTTSIALDPSGNSLYYVPAAHGKSWEQGTPLIRVDTRTGREDVVVSLNELAEERLGLRLGGTYNVAIDPTGRTIYLGMNAGKDGESFGSVVLVVIQL